MNTEELLVYVLSPTAQVGIIIGLAEIIKRLGVPSKWIPVVDVVLGLILGVLVNGLLAGYGIAQGVLVGVALGLSACGLFSGVKNVSGYYDDEINLRGE